MISLLFSPDQSHNLALQRTECNSFVHQSLINVEIFLVLNNITSRPYLLNEFIILIEKINYRINHM